MPDISVFKQRLRQFAEEARQKLPDVATTLTLSAKALAERNIKDHGFGIDYSENLIPAWFFHDKELNAGGAAWLKQHGVGGDGKPGEATHQKGKKRKKGVEEEKVDRFGNWKQFREAQGLQAGFVDLSYSNKMWAGMGPLSLVVKGDVFIVPLGATNRQAAKEMDYNFDRFGDFVGKGLTTDNFTTLAVSVSDQLRDILKSSNLQP